MCVSMYSLEHVQSHVETVPYVSVHIMYGPVLLEYVAAPLRPAPLDPDGSTCHEMSGGLSVARGTTRSATSTHCAATKTKGTWCFVARLFCKCIKRCGLFLATDGSVADMVMRHSHAAIRDSVSPYPRPNAPPARPRGGSLLWVRQCLPRHSVLPRPRWWFVVVCEMS